MRIAIYPGSFDPITLGHLNIIRRASRIFDHVIVCVMNNSDKNCLFPPHERKELIEKVVARLPNVEVDMSAVLLAEYAKQRGAARWSRACVPPRILKGIQMR
jgi:pantetheine-phosphate adenylyltransferase